MRAKVLIGFVFSLLVSLPTPATPSVSDPQSQSVGPGANVVLVVAASDWDPITLERLPIAFQWRFNGVDVPGATNASFVVTNAHPTNTGFYSVVARSPVGSTPSRCAFVSVVDPAEARTIEFRNDLTNTAQAFYQYCGGIFRPITNGTARLFAGPRLTAMLPEGAPTAVTNGFFNAGLIAVTNTPINSTAYCRVEITNPCDDPGFHQLSTIVLVPPGQSTLDGLQFPVSMDWPEPFFTAPGGGFQITQLGATFTLAMSVWTWSGHYSCQWFKNGIEIEGATNRDLTLTNVGSNDLASYQLSASSWTLNISQPVVVGVSYSGPGPRLSNPRRLGTNFLFEFVGEPIPSHPPSLLQWSSNLVTWNDLATMAGVTNAITITNPISPIDARFFRALRIWWK